MQTKEFHTANLTVMESGRLRRLAIPLVSLVILSLLALQVTASFGLLCPPRSISRLAPLRILCAPSLYPFLNYPMYSEVHYQGEKINKIMVYGLLEDGSRVAISEETLGMNFWLFQEFTYAVDQENKEKLKVYADLYHARQGRRLTAISMETHPQLITDRGIVPGPRVFVKEIHLEPPQEGLQ